MNYNKLLCAGRRRTNGNKRQVTDNRSEFERDYHRIIGSASFRRLQDKTQVFPLDKSDFIRTRLTHSLEVSSLAKSLGQTTGNMLVKAGEITAEQGQAMSDILLCAGLIHDIGNPPFGHFGETVIREWFSKRLYELEFKGKKLAEYLTEQQLSDLSHFEGNAQSLRVVTRLHHLVDDNGMNLTKALINTIIKYPVSSVECDSESDDIRFKKMGYFAADKEIFEDVTKSTGAGNFRHPLTFLLEAADDIAYSTADLEDGYKKGILSYQRLLHLLETDEEYISKKGTPECQDMEEAIKYLKKFYNSAVNTEIDPESYAVSNWVVRVQVMLIGAACNSYIENQKQILEGKKKEDLFKGTSSQVLAKVLKKIAYIHVFQIKDIVKLEIAASKILGSLLEEFVSAAIVYDTDEIATEKQKKLMQLISSNYLRIYNSESKDKDEGTKLYLRMLLVTDCISGMTDHYAKSLYQELCGIY